ncbi:MAG: acetylornithine deacetylase [bacterium]|nr:acetylornithine deacetylase [bacterium]
MESAGSYLYDTLRRLVAVDTVSAKGNLPLLQALADEFQDHGFRSRLQRWGEGDSIKANLVAVAGPEEPGGLILSGHIDVVPFADQPGWTGNPLELRVEGDRLYGRGTADMKGFVAQCLDAARSLRCDRLRRPLVIALTSDEEVGCTGAGRLIVELPKLLQGCPVPEHAWIGEPTSYRVFSAHKGLVEFEVVVTGKGGHSSLPEDGVNAIAVASQVVEAIGAVQTERRCRRTPSAELFPQCPYTSLNFASIQGGVAPNMIAESCSLVVTYRPLPDEEPLALYEEIRALLEGLEIRDWGSPDRPPQISVGPVTAAPGLVSQPGSPLERVLFERLEVTGSLGAPYCTDGGHLAALGTTPLICGPGELGQAHQPDESLGRHAFEAGTEHILFAVDRLCC